MCDNANQQIGNKQSQMIMPINTNSPNSAATIDESTAKSAMEQQQKQDQLKCPRCDSSNTKFCYYNNYSLSQPRHLCKACKRYWTRGGTLRNVPVGGSCRKNKRVKKQHNGSGSSDKAIKTAAINQNPNPNPNPSSQGIDPSFLYSNMNLAPFTSTIHHQPQLSTGLGSFSPIPSHFLNGNLPDLRLSANFLIGNDQYPVSNGSQVASLLVSSMNKQPKNEEYQSFLTLENANLADNNLMGNNNIIGSIDQWQTGNYPFESLSVAASSININGASDSSYLYWPDAANSSVAPLF